MLWQKKWSTVQETGFAETPHERSEGIAVQKFGPADVKLLAAELEQVAGLPAAGPDSVAVRIAESVAGERSSVPFPEQRPALLLLY